MQKDFMSMAQGQQAAPQEQNVQFSKEEVEGSEGMTEEELQGLGLPTGSSKEDIKQRLLVTFQKIGLLELYKTPDKKQEFTTLLNELVELFVQKNGQAIQNHPLMQQAMQISEQMQQQNMPQQPTGGPVPQQGAAPKDFSAMMPPTPGGGMSGR